MMELLEVQGTKYNFRFDRSDYSLHALIHMFLIHVGQTMITGVCDLHVSGVTNQGVYDLSNLIGQCIICFEIYTCMLKYGMFTHDIFH